MFSKAREIVCILKGHDLVRDDWTDKQKGVTIYASHRCKRCGFRAFVRSYRDRKMLYG